ncbi:hypothetical protein BOW53_08490, partial [Solemya pervernicosa gill symbiont]
GLSILVVDDNAINLTLATTLLDTEGATAVAAKSAEEALELVNKQRFDLILMDLEMPVMSGIEAAQQLKEVQSGGRATPIVALTAHAFPEKRQEALDVGMNDLLAKPYTAEQLYDVIKRWCVENESQTDAEALTQISASDDLPLYDREAALAAVGGNESVATQLLKQFMENLAISEAAMVSAQECSADEQLYQAIHKLAGSASSVGVLALHAEAIQLLELLRGESGSEGMVNDAIARLQALIMETKTTLSREVEALQ